jgi:hypothetical protein
MQCVYVTSTHCILCHLDRTIAVTNYNYKLLGYRVRAPAMRDTLRLQRTSFILIEG